ncbi:hypothetical protein J7M07_06135, partial [bacterium]|nr:hypothetical protein [bacterium]
MDAYALNNYSENLSGHVGYEHVKMGTPCESCHHSKHAAYFIIREFGEGYRFSGFHKKDISKLKPLHNKGETYFIARESGEDYKTPKLFDRANSTSKLSKLTGSVLSASSASQDSEISNGRLSVQSSNTLSTVSVAHLSELSNRVLPTVSAIHLSSLSDNALVARLESLRGKERKIQLNILLYIIEVEKRKLYLLRGYNSLFEFCTRHLGYSRAGAYRRIQASRCIGRFPKVAGLLLRGELNLSVVSLISGILTKENIN